MRQVESTEEPPPLFPAPLAGMGQGGQLEYHSGCNGVLGLQRAEMADLVALRSPA